MAHPRTTGRSHKAVPDAAFELWLGRALHALYGDATAEPIPPDLLAMIECDRRTEDVEPQGLDDVHYTLVKKADDR